MPRRGLSLPNWILLSLIRPFKWYPCSFTIVPIHLSTRRVNCCPCLIQFHLQSTVHVREHTVSSSTAIALKQDSRVLPSVVVSDCLNKVSHPEREHALLRLRMKSKGKMHRVVTPSCCACKNSTCKKKYCSCYRLGKLCSDSCRCVNCHNRMWSFVRLFT